MGVDRCKQPAVVPQQVGANQYQVINVNSGKALDINGGSTSDGAQVIQYSYHSGTNQMWAFTALGWGLYKFSPGSNANGSLNVTGGSLFDGSAIEQWTYGGWNSERWSISFAD